MEISDMDSPRTLITALKDFVSHTERIYLSLGEHFPRLIREMEEGIRTSREIVQEFQGQNREELSSTHSVSATLRETRRIIEDAGEMFRRMQERDDGVFHALEANMKRLSSLESAIDSIREDSVEMELVSLNAMTVALKAGSAGQAFSYITEELKRLSGKTIVMTETVTRNGEKLLQVFNTFKQRLTQVQNEQEELFGDLQSRLFLSFENFNSGVEQLVQILKNISDNAETVKAPLLGIMEEIQLQDIIKQSVHHVLISLEEAGKYSGETTAPETLLDRNSFLVTISDLCMGLMEEIEGKLRGSLDTFQVRTKDVRRIITSVEEERTSILTESSLNELFGNATLLLQDLLQDVGKIMKGKERIVEMGLVLTKEIHNVEEAFLSFTTLISRFRNVDIAARIEVAKQAVLRKMRDTVDAMTELIGKIEKDVNLSLSRTKDFIRETTETIGKYREYYAEELQTVDGFSGQIRRKYEELIDSKEDLNSRVSSFSVYTGDFFSLLSSTDNRLNELEVLLNDIRDIRAALSELNRKSRKAVEAELNRTGNTDWVLKNERLQNIINRFTIFTHKKAAGDLGGFSVEEGIKSGEITFF